MQTNGQSEEIIKIIMQRKSVEEEVRFGVFLPAKHTQNQVEHEKRANQDQCGEEDPWPLHSNSVIHLG